MAQPRTRRALVRLISLVELLETSRRGKTAAQLREALGSSRATVYRDLRSLEAAGIPLRTETVSGEVRYALARAAVPGVAVTPSAVAALAVARASLRHLDGTELATELDGLLRRAARELSTAAGVAAPRGLSLGDSGAASGDASVLRELDVARREKLRAVLEYRGRRDHAPWSREVEPLCWRTHGGQVYLAAFDRGRGDYRVFKASRIASVRVLQAKASPHADFDADTYFAQAVKAWGGGGEACSVVVRLSPRVARFAREWPLSAGQEVEVLGDGSALVRARVSGWVETMRWVLGWGADAEAVAPRELRAAMKDELRRAGARYAGGGGAGDARGVADR